MEELGTALPDGAVLLVFVGAVDAVPDAVAGHAVRDADGLPVLKEGLGAGKVPGILAGERVVGAPGPEGVQGESAGVTGAGGGPGERVGVADVLTAAV